MNRHKKQKVKNCSTQKLRTTSKKGWNKLPVFKVNIIVIVFLVLVGVGYLGAVNAITSNGYQIETIESHIADLRIESKNLELGLSDKQSMRNILAGVTHLGMIESDRIDYLTAPSTVVVKR